MSSTNAEYAEVKISQGALRGKKVTKKSNSFFSFQGIPYAKPPLGPLRFKPPQSPEPWKGTRDALKEGPMSAQIDFILQTAYIGEEDCLYLNVYTPELPRSGNVIRRPVMVFIHGGAFVGGAGNTNLYGPDYLVSEVVLVTINYRLGALGFLSLVDASIPGNNGLKDQVAALRWVKENIAHFGGDPNNVTIFGESAGGASVQFHVLSPMSKGLFHKAIAQSGSVFNPWAMCTPEQAKERAFRLGRKLGCSASDEKGLLQFLQSITPQQIVEASDDMGTGEDKKTRTLAFFLPVSEANSRDAFLPGNPADIIKEGKFNQVPYMTGLTTHEGICLIADLLKNPENVKEINEDFEFLLPLSLREKENRRDLADQIKMHYFNSNFTKESIVKLVDFYTHVWFLLGIHKTIQLLKQHSSQPIYYYLFEFVGELNFYKKFLKAESLPGASHIDDLGYLFRMDLMDIDVSPESASYNMVQKMVKLWTNFAKTGDPTANLDSDIEVKWPCVTKSNDYYLKINSKLSTAENLMNDEIKFWTKYMS